MEKQKILLISCGHFEKEVLDCLVQDIEHEFGFSVSYKECCLEMSGYYHPSRRQYNANDILKATAEASEAGFVKTIGLFRVDLFIPILTYIFGQAFLGGDTAIVSLFRLRNELYGLEPNRNLMIERFRKVVLHELGHSFGLIHCLNPVCIMRSSTYVEDIDQKKNVFCSACHDQLIKNSNRPLDVKKSPC